MRRLTACLMRANHIIGSQRAGHCVIRAERVRFHGGGVSTFQFPRHRRTGAAFPGKCRVSL